MLPDKSSATTMSMPLAFTCVVLFVNRGCASATMKAPAPASAMPQQISARERRDARPCLSPVSPTNTKTPAAPAPAFQPREHGQQQQQQQKIWMREGHAAGMLGWPSGRDRFDRGSVSSTNLRGRIVQRLQLVFARFIFARNFTMSHLDKNPPRLPFWSGRSRDACNSLPGIRPSSAPAREI